jgi:hypothetical protein
VDSVVGSEDSNFARRPFPAWFGHAATTNRRCEILPSDAVSPCGLRADRGAGRRRSARSGRRRTGTRCHRGAGSDAIEAWQPVVVAGDGLPVDDAVVRSQMRQPDRTIPYAHGVSTNTVHLQLTARTRPDGAASTDRWYGLPESHQRPLISFTFAAGMIWLEPFLVTRR